jgi:exosome complex protein LRP1
MSTTAAEAATAVPTSVVFAAEETLAAAESVGDHLSQLLAAAAEDPDAVAELPPLRRARAFLAVAHAATSLLAGTPCSPFRSLSLFTFFPSFLPDLSASILGIFAVRLRCSGIDPDEHPIWKEFVSALSS